jgi:hypothetical protein
MGWRQSGPRVRTLDSSAVTKVTGRGGAKIQGMAITVSKQWFLVFWGTSGVAVAAGISVRKAYNEKSLKPHLTQ